MVPAGSEAFYFTTLFFSSLSAPPLLSSLFCAKAKKGGERVRGGVFSASVKKEGLLDTIGQCGMRKKRIGKKISVVANK